MSITMYCSNCKNLLSACTCPSTYGMTATSTYPYMLPSESMAMRATLIESDLEKIRALVREVMQEELHKANMVILSAEEFDALMKRAAQ